MGSSLQQVDSIVEAILSWQERPFIYGDSDCCQFVSYVYKQSGGADYMTHKYQGKQEADLLLAQYGDLTSAVVDVLERCHVTPRWLRDGDLALCREKDSETLGIIMPSKVAVTVQNPNGKLLFLPWTTIEYGWRID